VIDDGTAAEPKVSIILPTHNRERELSRAIRSVLQQTYTHFELVVVDDCSTDGSADVVARFDDARIRYIKHDSRRGGGAARNSGIRASSSSFVAFQDSDDEWLPDKLERQMRHLREAPAEVGAVYCGYVRIGPGASENYFPQPGIARKEGNILESLLLKNFIGTPTLLVRRECFDRVGMFDERLSRFQDWELMIRIAGDFMVGFIPEPLVRAHYAGGNITSGHDRGLAEAEALILEKHRDAIAGAGGGILAYRLWHLSHLWFMCGEMATGRETLGRAMRVRARPLHLLSWLLSFNRHLYRSVYFIWSGGRASTERL
jgi:glycosyltransferase involved in cell wall biosynthesis